MPVNKRIFLLLLWATLLSLCLATVAGCGTSSKMAGDYGEAAPVSPGEAVRGEGEYNSIAGSEQPGGDALPRPRSRYFIRTGSLDLTVQDTRDAVVKIEEMAASGGGFVSRSDIYEFNEGQYSAMLTLRIPETRFDSFITGLQGLGEAANISKNSEDVTLPYLDLETRITNLKAEEARLREILTQAKTVQEILEVEREIFRVRGEIESMTAKFTHLQDQVALSTIEVSITEEVIGTQAISQKPFGNLGKRIRAAFFSSINFISSAAAFLLVALSALLPVLVIAIPAVLLVIWLIRAIRRKKADEQPPAAS